MEANNRERRNPSFSSILSGKSPISKPLLLLDSEAKATPSIAVKGKGGAGLSTNKLDFPGSLVAPPSDPASPDVTTKENSKCKPKYLVIPTHEITSTPVDEHIQFMQDHTIICKFIRLWPSEKALVGWLTNT